MPDSHPAYRDTVERYRIALRAWRMNWEYQAHDLNPFGMTERNYCDEYVRLNFHPFIWAAGDTAGQDWTQEHANAAFEEAKRGNA